MHGAAGLRGRRRGRARRLRERGTGEPRDSIDAGVDAGVDTGAATGRNSAGAELPARPDAARPDAARPHAARPDAARPHAALRCRPFRESRRHRTRRTGHAFAVGVREVERQPTTPTRLAIERIVRSRSRTLPRDRCVPRPRSNSSPNFVTTRPPRRGLGEGITTPRP